MEEREVVASRISKWSPPAGDWIEQEGLFPDRSGPALWKLLEKVNRVQLAGLTYSLAVLHCGSYDFAFTRTSIFEGRILLSILLQSLNRNLPPPPILSSQSQKPNGNHRGYAKWTTR
ncbi:hypothetical protein AKJ16_DCAP00559 [Drosera capensis]